jgi:hypothetical protein
MHFMCRTKVNDDMEFQYYVLKILVDKTTRLCNYMSFTTKWVKRTFENQQ